MSGIYSRLFARLLFCFITTVGTSPLPAAAKSFIATKISQTKSDIMGKIIKMNRAVSETGKRNFLGGIYVEGSSNYDRASINVNTQTRIFISSGGGRQRAANFDALRLNAQIQATFSGPVLESNPVQATAAEIIILVDGGNSVLTAFASSGLR